MVRNGKFGTDGLGQPARGFSLVEVMIVLVIVGLLAAVAYPGYRQYMIRANRSAAQQFMATVANREEQYVLDARAYSTTVGTGGLGLTVPTNVSTNYTITVSLQPGPPPGYTITATPLAPQSSDGALTLTSTGVKTPTDKW